MTAIEAWAEDELGPWRDDAACKGEPLESFFPDSPDQVPPEIRVLCSTCPVREDCFEHGLTHEAYGIWGGMSQAQLQRLRTARPRPARNSSPASARFATSSLATSPHPARARYRRRTS